MKRFILASLLAAGTLWSTAPANASIPGPLPAASSSFSAGSMHVDVYGTAGKPAMIFIPGLTCGPWEWAGEIKRFSPDYTIYALTLPGFDGQPPIQGPLFDTMTSDFWTLLQTRHIDKPVIVGHSLGGTLGIMLAEQHSDRLRAVVAVDGLPILPGMEKLPAQQRDAAATRMSAMMSALSTPAQFEAAEKTYSLPYLITSPADIDAVAPLTARSNAAATGQWLAEDTKADLRGQLNAISVPLLEIAPFDSQLDPKGPGQLTTAAAKQTYYQTLLKGAPTATVQIVQPSRHFIMYDQPQALHDVIARFLLGIRG